MNKVVLLLLFLFVSFQSVAAQAPYTEFKVGGMDPKKAKAGVLFGLNLGRTIDESLSWGLEINYYQKSFTEDQNVSVRSEGNLDAIETKVRTLDFTTRILPLLAKLNYEHPMGHRGPFYLRASAGLGWELVWNTEKNYIENIKRTSFFNGFGWQVSGGLGLAISSSGNLFADIFYNGSKVKRNETTNELGLPTWEELDISGLGFKLGVSIVGFGW